MALSESTPSVQSVDRALRILAYLAATPEAGVTEIAQDLDVHKSTAFRLVATLEAHDLVEQTAERGKYRLGMGLVRLAGAASSRLDVVEVSRPIVRDLAAGTGETVNLAILSGDAVLYIDQAVGSSTIQPHQWVGQRVPMHATSNGKVFLSSLPPAQRDELLTALPAFTPRTVTTRAALRRELAEVAERGYATAVDEMEEGLTAVAVPVRGAAGEVIASLSVSGLTMRLLPRVDEVLPLARAAGDEISRRMGSHQQPGAEAGDR